MKPSSCITSGALAYAVTAVAGVLLSCWASVFECRLLGDITLANLVKIIALGTVPILLIGVAFAWVTHKLLVTSELKPTLMRTVAVGTVLGSLPRLVESLLSTSPATTLYPSTDYIPFILSGVVMALVIRACSPTPERN